MRPIGFTSPGVGSTLVVRGHEIPFKRGSALDMYLRRTGGRFSGWCEISSKPERRWVPFFLVLVFERICSAVAEFRMAREARRLAHRFE